MYFFLIQVTVLVAIFLLRTPWYIKFLARYILPPLYPLINAILSVFTIQRGLFTKESTNIIRSRRNSTKRIFEYRRSARASLNRLGRQNYAPSPIWRWIASLLTYSPVRQLSDSLSWGRGRFGCLQWWALRPDALASDEHGTGNTAIEKWWNLSGSLSHCQRDGNYLNQHIYVP